jgi:hypothetical protein
MPKMVGIGWLEAATQAVKYDLKNFPYYMYLTLPFFLYASAAKTAQPIYTHDGSNDAACYKEVPFGVRVDRKLHSGVKTPRKPQILEPGCKISSQINTHE